MRVSRRGVLGGSVALTTYAGLHSPVMAMRDFTRPFDPTLLGTAVYWLRARDYWLMTDDGSGLISSTKDRIGSLALTAATTARPTWGATSFNTSFPGLTFDGTANCLTTTSMGNLPVNSTAGVIMAVGTFTTPTSASTGLIAEYGGTSGATLRGLGATNTGFPQVTDGSTNLNGNAAWTSPQNAILYASWSGTTEAGKINTAAMNTPVTIASLATGTSRFRIGANNAATQVRFMPMVLSDLLILNAVPVASDLAKLEGYFAWNRGLTSLLPSNHAYKSGPPAS